MLATLEENMGVYDEMRERLEAQNMGEWVLIYDKQLIGTYEDLQEVASVAASRFGNGSYHIKRIRRTAI